jgi:hypothetical protein
MGTKKGGQQLLRNVWVLFWKNFETCQLCIFVEISKESVSLEVSNSTANIFLLKSVHKDICRFTECEVHLKAKEAKIRVSQQYIFVNNLTPFSEYNVSIRCDSQETLIRFRTTEGSMDSHFFDFRYRFFSSSRKDIQIKFC